MTFHGNKIDKLRNMMGAQLPTKVLQIMTGIGMSLYKKSSYLEQNSYLHSQIYDFNPKYLKKEREKNLKFPQE